MAEIEEPQTTESTTTETPTDPCAKQRTLVDLLTKQLTAAESWRESELRRLNAVISMAQMEIEATNRQHEATVARLGRALRLAQQLLTKCEAGMPA